MIRAIVGANWGDEGKGKITDMYAADSDLVVRFQGAPMRDIPLLMRRGVLHFTFFRPAYAMSIS